MTFQAYLDAVKAQTGKTPADFAPLAKKKGLVKVGEIVAWLKADYALGHGHATAVAHVLTTAGQPPVSDDDAIAKHFAGKKAVWRQPYDSLLAKLHKFGPDVRVGAGKSYLSLLRGDKKFGILIPATPERFDIGLKLKGVPAEGPLEAGGDWNAMVTHRVRITAPKDINAQVLAWLKRAYEAAG